MQLPEFLKIAIEEKIAQIKLRSLVVASEKLTRSYREKRKKNSSFLNRSEDCLAYLTVRFPATYAANCHVLRAIKEKIPHLTVKSLLDLGAGPGTATWAVQELFPELTSATLIEKNRELIDLGRSLRENSFHWVEKDLKREISLEQHDLVIFSYFLGELAENIWKKLMLKAWEATKKIIVMIEPGTPTGFSHIRNVREELISLGAHLVAPCPHEKQCPLAQGDWCHFSQRIARSSLHRKIKKGELGYEDEKFSYVAFSKEKICLSTPRLIRHPEKFSKLIRMTLCTVQGIESKNISKSEKENYKMARKATWGSLLKLNTPPLQ
jgi:ribosomal protein RSM22 (predicted rRNA methylase)